MNPLPVTPNAKAYVDPIWYAFVVRIPRENLPGKARSLTCVVKCDPPADFEPPALPPFVSGYLPALPSFDRDFEFLLP